MYIVVFLFLLILAWIEHRTNLKRGWIIGIVVLTSMAVFRYGQGTDYFAYMYNYKHIDLHSEAGYLILCSLLKWLHAPFEALIALISLFDMICVTRSIKKYSDYKALSLCFLFPTIYLTYIYSAIRQSIVICFFLGFLLQWLLEGKYKKYVIGVLIMTTFHSSALILLMLLFIKKASYKTLWIIICISGLMGIAFLALPASFFSFISIGSFQSYLGSKNYSVGGMAERTFMFLTIIAMFGKSKINSEDKYSVLLKIYMIGFAVTILFMGNSLTSSRLGACFKATEIILIPNLLFKQEMFFEKKFAGCTLTLLNLYRLIFIVYMAFMVLKNIDVYIEQGQYNCNILNYPYISILNKDAIYKYRHIPSLYISEN